MNSGAEKEEIEEMRILMKHDGWKENEYLPQKWFYIEKQEGEKGIIIVSKEGKLFHFYKGAVLFMRSNSDYTDEDIKKIYLCPEGDERLAKQRECKTGNGQGEEKKFSVSDIDWLDNDETVPKGWKIKNALEGKQAFLSPEGQVMSSRRSVL